MNNAVRKALTLHSQPYLVVLDRDYWSNRTGEYLE